MNATSVPTVRRWTNMLQGLGLFAELTPESPIIAAILEGRDADAIAECERLAEEAKALHAAFLAEQPKLARRRERVIREEGSRGYGAWLEWVDDPKSHRRPYGDPPLSVPELRELAWFEGELEPLARALPTGPRPLGWHVGSMLFGAPGSKFDDHRRGRTKTRSPNDRVFQVSP